MFWCTTRIAATAILLGTVLGGAPGAAWGATPQHSGDGNTSLGRQSPVKHGAAWRLGAEQGVDGQIADSVTAAVWECTGHSNTPGIVVDGSHRNWISYSAFQNCVGTFGTQQVCIKLQERDHFGNYYDRTIYECSVQTVMPQAFKGRSVLCSQAGHGTFRTAAFGRAWPEGVRWQSGARYSYSATLC